MLPDHERASHELTAFIFAPMVYDAVHARKHAMAESLIALGIDAVYVEPPNSNSRYRATRRHTLNAGLPGLNPPSMWMRAENGTGVLSVPKRIGIGPLRLPLPRRAQERLQARWLERFFERVREGTHARCLGIVTTAVWEPKVRNIPFDLLVYDKTEPANVLRGRTSEKEYQDQERALVARSALVTAVTQSLADDVKSHAPGAATLVVPNGLEPAHFDVHKDDPVPELDGLPRPIAGFVGTVTPHVDVELLVAFAKAHPTWTTVVVGPASSWVSLDGFAALPNARVFGRQRYERIPAIMNALDVALMPFKPGEFSRIANPVTLYEFLYLGKPVVCTDMPPVEPIADLLYMSREKFVANGSLAMGEDGTSLRHRRRALAEQHGWKALTSTMVKALGIETAATGT